MNKVLHYIHDPLCGWCYAAEQLVDAVHARAQGQFGIQLHAGGLFSRARLSDAKRAHIRSADARIGELTGQVFGDAYLNGLLSDPDTVYDSIVPIRGILAAEMVRPEGGLPMLKSLQRAHYRSGLRIVEPATIADVAESSGFDKVQFAVAFQCISAAELRQHLDKTHRLMQVVGAHGYPTFVAQIGNELQLLQHDRFYGNPNGFGDLVSNILAPQAQAGGPDDNVAAPDGRFGQCEGDTCIF